MPDVVDTFKVLGDMLDRSPDARQRYEVQVASKDRVLDVGGRNEHSRTAKLLRQLSTNASTAIVSTDILPEYEPDLVDDITATTIPPESFDGIYCDAVLEHVTDPDAAVANMHSILTVGGEVFIYVPFVFWFHDNMDHHRFTITELARMMERFSEAKVFLPTAPSGFGWVALHVLTYGQAGRAPRLQRAVANGMNAMLDAAVTLQYRRKPRDYSLEDARLFYTHFVFNHGFCAWGRK